MPLAVALRDAGYAVWVPEYRRVGDPGGGWPATWLDVVAAIKAIDTARDPQRGLIAVGHSAGGHLALMAATVENSPLDAVVALAPITDLTAYGAAEGSCQSMTARLMGASAEADEYRRASPSAYKLALPVQLLRGDLDPIVPASQLEVMAGAMQRVVPGAGHFDLVHPGTAAFPVLIQALETSL